MSAKEQQAKPGGRRPARRWQPWQLAEMVALYDEIKIPPGGKYRPKGDVLALAQSFNCTTEDLIRAVSYHKRKLAGG